MDTVIVPPPSYWRELKGQKVFNIAENVIESHVSVLSVVTPNVAEFYLIKVRNLMSDCEKKRAEPVFQT